MLSPFQQQIAAIVAGLDEARDFALAGGAALISRGDVERQTRDLDFFGPAPVDVDDLLPAVERAVRDAGLTARRIQVSPGFARLTVEGPDGQVEVDLAADARLFPPEPGPMGATLSGEELAVDKVLAIFGRAEARDFIDLWAVEPRYGIERLCELAAEKDRGFTRTVFAQMLSRFGRLARNEFAIDDDRFAELEARVQEWRIWALEPARSEDLRIDVDRYRDDDIGLGL